MWGQLPGAGGTIHVAWLHPTLGLVKSLYLWNLGFFLWVGMASGNC